MLGTVSGTKEIYYKLHVITIHFFLLSSPDYVNDDSLGRSNNLQLHDACNPYVS